MTDKTVEIVEVVEETAVTPIEKIKTALKKVDPKVYTVAAIAVAGALGFAAYKRIENFETREADRLVETDTIEIVEG